MRFLDPVVMTFLWPICNRSGRTMPRARLDTPGRVVFVTGSRVNQCGGVSLGLAGLPLRGVILPWLPSHCGLGVLLQLGLAQGGSRFLCRLKSLFGFLAFLGGLVLCLVLMRTF
jgi:hypothetical protein